MIHAKAVSRAIDEGDAVHGAGLVGDGEVTIGLDVTNKSVEVQSLRV